MSSIYSAFNSYNLIIATKRCIKNNIIRENIYYYFAIYNILERDDNVEMQKVLSSDHNFYQEVTKNLNDYYYNHESIVCVKFSKQVSGLYKMEVYVLKEEYETPIKMPFELNRKDFEIMMTDICNDIHYVSTLLREYRNDIPDSNKDYITSFINFCIDSIEKYEISTVAIDDLSLPSHELNFVVIGNMSFRDKKGRTLTELSLQYTLKQLFPDIKKSTVHSLIERYKDIFMDLCIVRDNSKKQLFH